MDLGHLMPISQILAEPAEDFHHQVIRVSPNGAGKALRSMPGAQKKSQKQNYFCDFSIKIR